MKGVNTEEGIRGIISGVAGGARKGGVAFSNFFKNHKDFLPKFIKFSSNFDQKSPNFEHFWLKNVNFRKKFSPATQNYVKNAIFSQKLWVLQPKKGWQNFSGEDSAKIFEI